MGEPPRDALFTAALALYLTSFALPGLDGMGGVPPRYVPGHANARLALLLLAVGPEQWSWSPETVLGVGGTVANALTLVLAVGLLLGARAHHLGRALLALCAVIAVALAASALVSLAPLAWLGAMATLGAIAVGRAPVRSTCDPVYLAALAGSCVGLCWLAWLTTPST